MIKPIQPTQPTQRGAEFLRVEVLFKILMK
jgi:hypothetical protein